MDGFPLRFERELTSSSDIPSYMLISVSTPRARPSRDKTDFSISLNLRE